MKTKSKKNIIALFFILPTLILILLFSIIPFIYAFKLSLYETNGIGTDIFVGFSNFINIFKDPVIYQSFINLGIFLIFGIVLGTIGPMIGAKLIFMLKNTKLAYCFRIIFVLPMIIPGMVTILLWRNMYKFKMGAINELLNAIGLSCLATDWLGNVNTAIYALIFMGVPWVGGVGMLIYLAGYLNIPKSYYEAAKIEGAKWYHYIIHIEIPNIRPQICIAVFTSIIGTIGTYVTMLVMTEGGPMNSTMVPALYLFKNAFEYGRLGYATAIGVILFVIGVILSYFNMKFIKGGE